MQESKREITKVVTLVDGGKSVECIQSPEASHEISSLIFSEKYLKKNSEHPMLLVILISAKWIKVARYT